MGRSQTKEKALARMNGFLIPVAHMKFLSHSRPSRNSRYSNGSYMFVSFDSSTCFMKNLVAIFEEKISVFKEDEGCDEDI